MVGHRLVSYFDDHVTVFGAAIEVDFLPCNLKTCLYRITTDPVELWTSEDSVSRMQKIDYDSQFGTTYRTCQV